MRVSKAQPSGRLKLIFHLKEPLVSEDGIDIIVIPGTFSQYSRKESRETCSWLKPLIAATSNDTRVFYFLYELHADGSSIWKQLLSHGLSLTDAVRRLQDDTQTRHRPILFICHSLGGIILKQALWIAHQESDSEHSLESLTSGIVFMSTPHTTSPADERWENWKWILKSSRRDFSKFVQTAEDIRSLAATCQNFENLDLQIPILSVFETAKSRVRDGFLNLIRGGTRRHILVDQDMCQTHNTYEQIFAVESEHSDVWRVEAESQFYLRLTKFLRSITEEAPANIRFLFDKPVFKEFLIVPFAPSVFSSDQSMDTPQSSSQAGTANKSADTKAPPTLETLADFESPVRGGRVPAYLMNGHRRNQDFFAREDVLQQIDDAFFSTTKTNDAQPPSTELRSVVLCGIGGIGKTEVAMEYAFRRKDKFDAIFWVNSDTKEKLNLGFSDIAQALGLEDKPAPKDDIATREIVKGWLTKPIIASNQGTAKANDEASWLLLLDNVDDVDTLYDDFWPHTGTGCVIVTSRNPISKDAIFSPTCCIDLTPFEVDKASLFLQSLSQREHEKNSLKCCARIAEVVGGLPLAITQMAGIIRRRGLSLEDFLVYYNEDARRLHEMRIPGSNTHYKQTVASVWMLEALKKPALTLLQVLSFLDPDRIQEGILIQDTKNIKLPDYPKSKVSYLDARTELIQSSLISYDIKSSELRIHRLVQDVVREQLSGEAKMAVFEATITLLSNCWPFVNFDDRNRLTRLQQAEILFPHIEKIVSLFGNLIQSHNFQPPISSAALFNEVAWYMIERADDAKCGLYASLSLAIFDNVPGEKFRQSEELNRKLSQSHQYKAVSCIFTDSPGGLDHLKTMIALIVERLAKWNRTEDAIQLADAYNESAMAYMRENEEKKAIESWIQSYNAFGDVAGDPLDSKIRQEWPAIHLATMYSIRGEWEKGEDIVLPVLHAREKKFGKDDTTSMVAGKVLHALGDVRRAQGALEEALSLFQRALAIFRVTIGDNHYITADTCYRLAEQLITIRVGKEHEANVLLEQSLKVYRDIRWYKPQAARSSFMKGKLLRQMGNDVEGDAQIARAMKLREELVPDDKRTADQLGYDDFDDTVYYMSR